VGVELKKRRRGGEWKKLQPPPPPHHLIDGGLTFGDLTILSNFLFNKGLFVWLLVPPLFLGSRGVLFFTSISTVDVTSAQSGLDH
jgi:hypothetical protein